MDTTKFKSFFPTLLTADNLEDCLLDQLLVNPSQRIFGYETKPTDHGWQLLIPIPGASKDDISVEVKESKQLIVRAEGDSVWGNKQIRRFKMSVDSDPDNIEGEMKNGILTLFIPKKKSFSDKVVKIK